MKDSSCVVFMLFFTVNLLRSFAFILAIHGNQREISSAPI